MNTEPKPPEDSFEFVWRAEGYPSLVCHLEHCEAEFYQFGQIDGYCVLEKAYLNGTEVTYLLSESVIEKIEEAAVKTVGVRGVA